MLFYVQSLFSKCPQVFFNIQNFYGTLLHMRQNEKRTEAGKILPDHSPSYILRPFAQSANRNSLERSHTLLLLLSQILVNYTYKFFYRNSVNHASLFQRLHLRRRASDAVHSSAH